MSAPLKVLIGLVVWLLYSLLAYQGCIKECCPGANTAITGADTTATTAPQRYPVDFQWSSATANTNEGYEEWKRELLSKMKPGQILEITGLYYDAEPKPDGYDNMGFARADQVKKLFLKDVPEDKIRLRARVVDEKEGVRTGYFESALLEWIQPEQTVNKTVEELDDRIIIRFPYNSTEREYDPAVEEYLTKLADRVKTTGESIQLTGHTDNKGTPEYNLRLGKTRTDVIRNLLIGKGVKAEQVTAESKGQSQPVDNNNTEEGRHNNRRVEVRLIKKQ